MPRETRTLPMRRHPLAEAPRPEKGRDVGTLRPRWVLDRRTFVGAVASCLWAASMPVRAQPAGKVARVGLLASGVLRTDAEFRQSNWAVAMRELGWVEGKNVVYERRASNGRLELLPELARELVRAGVDVIATFSDRDTLAAKQATSAIPIVMIFAGIDPVAEGFVASFAKPGGNITGVSRMLAETDAKRLSLLREMLPSASRIGVLYYSSGDAEAGTKFERRMRAAARDLRIEPQFFTYRNPDDLDAAMPAMASARVQAFVLEPHFLAFSHRARIAELALQHRLPGVFTLREYAAAGGLLSYGPDYAALERQQVRYVDRILRGTSPGDLPIEQPTKFELVVNGKTARTLGIAIPEPLRLRADEVIQ